MKQHGFTLLELLIVIAMMAMLAGFGVRSFVAYNQKQQLDIATQDVEAALQNAKSLALANASVGKDCTSSYTFIGYEIYTSKGNNYNLYYICESNTDPTKNASHLVKKFFLPPNVVFDPTGSNHYVFFHTIEGTVWLSQDGSVWAKNGVTVDITLQHKATKQTETIEVNNSGVIGVQ